MGKKNEHGIEVGLTGSGLRVKGRLIKGFSWFGLGVSAVLFFAAPSGFWFLTGMICVIGIAVGKIMEWAAT
ncbi:hypothetical protein [[Limnothrix rosea] IAM M-220]|uniref:hypothetical protein n=1 Tax=[Limnothrix rosea] IAM M-220 TaxID=454133 RepID=UPI001115783D|nr:hypothetical protein [[Limnothrix rosea] IAM M-220]